MSYITEVDILDEAKECFLTYASEVLTDRAIPSAEDGLLSSQRKILWTMENILGMSNKSKTKKCNAIVGSTLMTSYFHGDASCYGVLCKMSQEYLYRYPLISGQGALGTQADNDMVSSSRYTEAKPSIYADLMMEDYKKNPVPTKETYNGEYFEPVFLPAVFPNALCNGREAIGISMSHSSLPHNLSEVCDGILAYIKNPRITIQELMQYIPGPDFPLKNTVINSSAIKTAFETGKSAVSLKVRGNYTISGDKITFDAIPYRTYRNKIKEQLEKNVDEFENYLEDFQDLSQIGDNKLVFIASPGMAEQLLQKLFKYTDLQNTVSYNMNFIIDGTPKLCSLKDLIVSYVEHQHNCLINITKTDLAKAQEKKHTLEGLLTVLKDIDKAIFLIKNADDKAMARKCLMDYFKLTEVQANAVLDMKLAKLTKLDRDDLLKQLEELTSTIAKYEKILNDKNYRNEVISKKVSDLKAKYGDSRRTELLQLESTTPTSTPTVSEPCTVSITPNFSARKVSRKTKDLCIKTTTTSTIPVFTNLGQCYKLPVAQLTTAAQKISSLIKLKPGEEIVGVHDGTAPYLLFVTSAGIVKKTAAEEYTATAKSCKAIKVREGDKVHCVLSINDENIVLITQNSIGLKFSSTDVSPTGKTAQGVIGIKLEDGDKIEKTFADNEFDLPLGKRAGKGKKIDY